MDDVLLGDLFDRLDTVPLGGKAEVLLFGALEDEGALARAFDADAPSTPERGPVIAAARVGPKLAWLRKVTVQGFRRVGPEVTLHLRAQPGLTLVVGRNGSGKSSFAEGIELLLTGSVARWADKQAVWKAGVVEPPSPGRCLHRGCTARRRGGRDGDGGRQVGERRRDRCGGRLREGRARMGARLFGVPAVPVSRRAGSHARPAIRAYDRLSGVLGLEEVPAALKLLADRRKSIDAEVKAPKADLPGLLADLNACSDGRGRAAAAAFGARKADLDTAERIATAAAQGHGDDGLDALRHVARTVLPDVGPITADLRGVAAGLVAVSGTDAESAARTASLLRDALRLHADHGDQPCPVCGAGALDGAWRAAAAADADRLEAEAASWRDAQRAASVAGEAVRRLPPLPGAAAWEAVRNATGPFGVDQLRRLAQELDVAVDAARTSVDDATAELASREDVWGPLAARVVAHVALRRRAEGLQGDLKAIKAAETWLKRGPPRPAEPSPRADQGRSRQGVGPPPPGEQRRAGRSPTHRDREVPAGSRGGGHRGW